MVKIKSIIRPNRGRPGGNPAAMQRRGEPAHNPYGAPPKERNINRILREIGKECASGVEGARTRLEVVLRRVYQLAQRGEPWAVNFIADRTEGKPAQVMVQAGAVGVFNADNAKDMALTDLIALVQQLSGGSLGNDEQPQTITVSESKPLKELPAHDAHRSQPS